MTWLFIKEFSSSHWEESPFAAIKNDWNCDIKLLFYLSLISRITLIISIILCYL